MARRGDGVILEPQREVAQHPFELEQLLRVVRDHGPFTILEVGVWHGGTLWHWLQEAETVVGVDNAMLDKDDWHAWADDAGAHLDLLQGDSTDPGMVNLVRAHGPFDMVFIDAAHDYASVKSDWENYGPMVNEGGMVVFHDIAPRPDYGVSQLWNEITPGQNSLAIWGGVPGYCGIGVIYS